MKSLTRTIIALVIINLMIGNFTLAQDAPGEPVRTARSRVGAPRHPESVQPTAPSEPMLETYPEPEPVPTPMTAPPVPRPYGMGAFGLSRNRKVLVIPSTDVEAEGLVAITEDLQVMSHIFDERFKEPQEIKGVFVDFGDFFGRSNRSTEAIYMQGYGVLFLMEVNFAFSAEPEPQEQEAQETKEYVDPDWQRAKQKLFSPQGFGGTSVPEEQYNAQQIEQIKTELIRTLKHAANIRNLQPDEWIILTVIGQSRQSGGMYEGYYRSAAPKSGLSRSRGRSSSNSRGGYGGGMMGGGFGGGMGGGMMSGGMGSGSMGGQAFGGGVMMGGMSTMYGEDYSETGSASTTVLTIRAKKLHVDAFASGDLDFERFQKKVDIFTY